MYHFYFNLPKNDKNKGTVYLPRKSSVNLPVIISCYGWNSIHWPMRVEEALRDLAVKKNDIGFVTMELHGHSDDSDPAACDRWESNLADMISWVKEKKFADPSKVGVFAFGLPAAAAMRLAIGDSGAAFAVVNPLGMDESIAKAFAIPTLTVHGTGEKIKIQSQAMQTDDVIRQVGPEVNKQSIVFKGSDDYLYNISGQAAQEIVRWLNVHV